MKTAITLFISYLLAAALSEHVSMNVVESHWGNIWTYFWIVFALPISFALAALVVLLLAASGDLATRIRK